MIVLLLLSSLSLTGSGDSTTRLSTHDQVLDGTAAAIGGIAGFAATYYLAFFALGSTEVTGENFRTEAALGLGYAVGMPIGAALGLDFVAKKKGRAPAFRTSFKNAEIGAAIGIAAVMIGGIVSTDVEYWMAMAVLPLPVIGCAAGYHRSIELQQNTIQNGDAVLHYCTFTFRIWECELK